MPTPLTPSERTMRARLAAHHLHAQRNSRDTSAAARAAFLASFETKVDPEGQLPVDERRRRAEQLRKAHMTTLAFKAAKARRSRQAPKAERDAGTAKGPDTTTTTIAGPTTESGGRDGL